MSEPAVPAFASGQGFVVPAADGAMLILVQPSVGMKDFFDRVAQLSPEQLQDLGYINGLFSECGMQVVGPPLASESASEP